MHAFEQSNTKLAFIGLGNMGSRIAGRLLASGYAVSVFDKYRSKAESLKEKGAKPLDSLAELANSVNVVLSCLTNDQAVRDVYYGPEGVLANASAGLVILEMSTVSPATSRELAKKAAELSIQVLDVAISGSTPAAEAGTLLLLAGGNPECFQAARPIFQAIASKYFHLGASGAGTTMKLVVNAILGIGMQAIAEAAALGEKAGLSRDVLLEVLAQMAVIAPAHAGKLSRVARGDYDPQFPLPLMNKDFRLILQLAEEVQALMPATSASFQINNEAMATYADQDFSIVVKVMDDLKAKTPAAKSTAG
ncbi:MAG TPA: NAD(P)-dependent oxidoreductase [Candidatus Acidoferrum sp.]|jgi:3-hydroxyisobutyrate dehydrogenase-like beta-hydroxyacid dehydrogenase